MLKKAGIVVAAAAACLLAVSPLAFAGDEGHHKHGYGGGDQVNKVEEGHTVGLVNVTDNQVTLPLQVCNNDIPVNVLGIQLSDLQGDLVGALGLLGIAENEDEGFNGDFRICEQDSAVTGDTVFQKNHD